MIHLKPVDYVTISPWIADFQKRSKYYEPPPNGSEYLGIYRRDELIGYFITVWHPQARTLEINQGYLKPEARHKNLSRISMKLLENAAKKLDVQKVMLGTHRTIGSYIRFMRSMGYDIEQAIFSKELS